MSKSKKKKVKSGSQKKQQTNFDMIRHMDDTELAFFIIHSTGCDKCDNFKNSQNKKSACALTQCSDYWMKWGKSPAQPINLDNMH